MGAFSAQHQPPATTTHLHHGSSQVHTIPLPRWLETLRSSFSPRPQQAFCSSHFPMHGFPVLELTVSHLCA